MGDDDELRARIEAQVASRRAAAPPPKRDRFGRNGQDGDPGADAAAPRSLEPARPWLTGEAISFDPDESDDGVENGDQPGNSRNLGPARPWLSRPAALPGATGPPPPHDPASGTQLQPVRPWLRRAVKAEPDQPDEPEPAAAGPAIESVDDSTSPPQPARVLQEHWARERAALIAERAALMAEREALLAHRTALSGLRESTVAADPEIEPAARKRGRLGRRRPAAVHSDGATAEAAPHAAAPGQPGAPQSGPVSPFESFRTPEVVSAPAVERPADDPDLAGGDSRLGADEQHDAPEHIDVDAAVEGDEGARTGWSRRTLGWLLAPAEQPQHREPSTEETAPGDEDDRVRAPEQHGLPPWRLLPDVEPAAPARANRPEPEPVAEQPVPVPLPVPEPQPLSEPKPEPAAAAGAAEHPPVGPGTDLPRRLAAANAAAMARALASEAYDFPEDDDDDGDVPRQRRAAAFVRPSGPRPAGIARERDETAATSSPLVTGTAFAQRNVPPADIDADGPTPPVAKRHRVTVRGAARLLVVVVIAAVIATLLRTYVIAPYYIPSASMEPTLHGCTGCNNDHVLVDKLSYKMHDIHRGDVVVFHRPKAWQVTEQVLIKRVIGLPGDKLSARNGIVYVDGLALEEPYLDKACQSGTTNLPTKPVTVPDGEAYVMGDNRCDSSDSRRFGAIPDSAVIGRAFLIVWPLGRLHWL